MRQAIRHLRQHYGETPAAELGPLRPYALREAYIARGSCRRSVNRRIGRIQRILKLGIKQLVTPNVHHGLGTVAGLEIGRSEALESGAGASRPRPGHCRRADVSEPSVEGDGGTVTGRRDAAGVSRLAGPRRRELRRWHLGGPAGVAQNFAPRPGTNRLHRPESASAAVLAVRQAGRCVLFRSGRSRPPCRGHALPNAANLGSIGAAKSSVGITGESAGRALHHLRCPIRSSFRHPPFAGVTGKFRQSRWVRANWVTAPAASTSRSRLRPCC